MNFSAVAFARSIGCLAGLRRPGLTCLWFVSAFFAAAGVHAQTTIMSFNPSFKAIGVSNFAAAAPIYGTSAALSAGGGTYDLAVPGSPTGVGAVAGDGQATVSFSAPASNGGATITGYTVTAAPGGASATSAAPGAATVTGLQNGISYTFTVTATNSKGVGPSSSPSSPVSPFTVITVSLPPWNVSAVAGNKQATVSFSEPTNNGGGNITNYTVTTSPGGRTASGPASPISVTGLSNGTSYTFTVRADNVAGTSAASAASNAVTPFLPVTVPRPPTSVTATAGNTRATVSFVPPVDDGGASITGYTVTATPGPRTATGASSPIVVTGLTNGTGYTFTVTATNAIGASIASSASATITPALLPGIISTVAGNGTAAYAGDKGAATAASLKSPGGVAADALGNIYIADYSDHRIRKVAAGTGVISTYVGFGSASYGGDGGPAVNASLNSPAGIAVDSAGNLYIADYANNRVRKVAAATGLITSIAGTGTADYFGDNGQARIAALAQPTGVAVDGAGNVYIADYFNHRIRKVAAATGIITTVAGNGRPAYAGDNGPATAASIAFPNGVAVDATGNLYIADYSNHRIRRIAAATGIITTLAGNGSAADGGDGGPASAASLRWPAHVVVDAAGNVYIADSGNNRVRKVAFATGNISTVAGNGSKGYSGDNDQATSSMLNGPSGVALDGNENLYIADRDNARVRMVLGETKALAQIPDPPSNVSAIATNGLVTVSFNAPANNGGALVTRYTVTASLGGASVTTTESPAVFSGLPAGVRETFTVTATNSAGTSASSSGASAVAPPMMAASGETTFAIDATGNLFGWGSDSSGKLGVGRLLQVTSAVPIAAAGSFDKVSAGSLHIVALKSDGTLWAWGDNTGGQIGDGTKASRSLPKQVAQGFGGGIIATGETSTAAIKSDGSLWAWGSNIGNDSLAPSLQPKQIGGDFISVATGPSHTVAIKRDGSLWAWGTNAYGQLGDGTTTDRFVPKLIDTGYASVVVGFTHTIGVKSNGTVWAWGDNRYGQLGAGIVSKSVFPTYIGGGFRDIAAGANHNIAVKSDGSVWAWGDNTYGQLGDGTTVKASAPKQVSARLGPSLDAYLSVSAGKYHSVVVAADGSVWTWGDNRNGQLGDGTTTASAVPKRVALGYKTASAGYWSTVAVRSDGSLWAWGSDSSGGLGTGAVLANSAPKAIGANYVSVSSAYWNTLGLKSDGSLWAWGDNTFGQLGNGTTIDSSIPVAVGSGYAMGVMGGFHAAALKIDGSLWSWGSNAQGQLGDGTKTDSSVPKQRGSNYAAVALGNAHTLALKSDGSLWAWGDNTYGQLGDGTTLERLLPVQIGTGYMSIAAGSYHSVAAKADGSLWAWGGNWYGQVGDGTVITRLSPKQVGNSVIAVAAGYTHTVVLTSDDKLWTWGSNTYGQLGDGTTTSSLGPKPVGTGYTAISAGFWHTLAAKRDGSLHAWGFNSVGQIGNGTLAATTLPAGVLNGTATGYFSLTGASPDASTDPLSILQIARKTDTDFSTRLTDLRATGFSGEIYFTALLPATSPIVNRRGHRDGQVGMVAVTFTRNGFKQTGPTQTADSNYSGTISTGSEYSVYEKSLIDPLANSNAVICMGLTAPGLSAKGQVLMRAVATGDRVSGVVQCPTVQTPMTTQMYTAQASGPITSRSVTASINPLAEDRGQVRSVYSWAVAPDGRQFMQIGPNQWVAMAEPMLPAMTLTVPATGSITLPVISNLDLSPLPGTLVYVGLGLNWDDVRSFNKAGHCYTVQ